MPVEFSLQEPCLGALWPCRKSAAGEFRGQIKIPSQNCDSGRAEQSAQVAGLILQSLVVRALGILDMAESELGIALDRAKFASLGSLHVDATHDLVKNLLELALRQQ